MPGARRKRNEEDGAADGPCDAGPRQPKYPQPKILLIDIKDGSESALADEGFAVVSGTFGAPYKVEKKDAWFPVVFDASLPSYTEQDIVVIDLVAPEPTDEPPGEKHVSQGGMDWWASCTTGVIDPRVRRQLVFPSSDN